MSTQLANRCQTLKTHLDAEGHRVLYDTLDSPSNPTNAIPRLLLEECGRISLARFNLSCCIFLLRLWSRYPARMSPEKVLRSIAEALADGSASRLDGEVLRSELKMLRSISRSRPSTSTDCIDLGYQAIEDLIGSLTHDADEDSLHVMSSAYMAIFESGSPPHGVPPNEFLVWAADSAMDVANGV